MKSTLEPLEGNKIKLSVEVEDAEFSHDIDAAFRKLAQEVRLPGFRPGKAPRKLLEARIGLAPAREQALRDGIPQYLAKAVREQAEVYARDDRMRERSKPKAHNSGRVGPAGPDAFLSRVDPSVLVKLDRKMRMVDGVPEPGPASRPR